MAKEVVRIIQVTAGAVLRALVQAEEIVLGLQAGGPTGLV